jgi:hypothetical protein
VGDLRKKRKSDLLGPQRVSEVIAISIVKPPVTNVFSGNLRSLWRMSDAQLAANNKNGVPSCLQSRYQFLRRQQLFQL